ncbi:MAG: nitroreductase [Pseudomonadota bacterium]
MKVSQALDARKSIRAFTEKKIPPETLLSVFERASRAPSGGNLQPWRIVILSETKLDAFKSLMEKRLGGEPNPDGEGAEYAVYPPNLKEPYRTVRYEVGEEMYRLLGISRDEKPKRLEWFANNFRFFNAPAGAFCFVDRIMGPPQWSDLGMYLQSVMLLFQEHGIDTCAQECWSAYPKTVHQFCEMPDELMLFCGMAIGYRDQSHPVNDLKTKRLPASDWLKVL